MTIDAMQWVWTQSRNTGNPRLVLLAVADKAPGPDCTARMGTTEFRARLGNVSKSVVVRAVDKALESGELVMVEEARGSRPAAYQLPKAVGFVRPKPGATGPDSGPLSDGYRSRIETPNAQQGSRIETPSDSATGPESVPGGSRIETPSDSATGPESVPGGSRIETPTGPESVPLYQTTPTRSESKLAPEPAPEPIPANARPLVDALTTAGVLVRWNLSHTDWFVVEALIKRSGIPALAAYAQRQAAAKDISYARYFLPGWRDLPPLPEQPAGPRPLRAVGGGGSAWQPYQNPNNPSVYENGF
ncbi:hypothetical protein [Streptomyces xantholiticus]|uniref:hypothetical protein n=1 Tax=Streptomyces xantholiticus TaxID=68285 RepID=UPI0016766818|nr:hypothetical protein [Streptomyces xantholiticus]GGW41123.1 hypothetical protein GCM10010381_27450 [Streptomyces xantholiticus]